MKTKQTKHFPLMHGSVQPHYLYCVKITETGVKRIFLQTGAQEQSSLLVINIVYTQKVSTPSNS